MQEIIYNQEGKEVGKADLPAEVFDVKMNQDLVHQVMVAQMANARQVLAHTKDRSEVRGGGVKPWRQKGTGRARHGSIRSPIWKGGGVTFGPQPRDYSYSINRKAKKVALQSAILSKLQDSEVVLIDKLEFDSPSTKKMANLLKSLGIKKSCLIVIPELNEAIWKSSRNIYNLKVRVASDLNAYDVIKYKQLLIVKDVLDNIKFK